jgi:hypothetical protein
LRLLFYPVRRAFREKGLPWRNRYRLALVREDRLTVAIPNVGWYNVTVSVSKNVDYLRGLDLLLGVQSHLVMSLSSKLGDTSKPKFAYFIETVSVLAEVCGCS